MMARPILLLSGALAASIIVGAYPAALDEALPPQGPSAAPRLAPGPQTTDRLIVRLRENAVAPPGADPGRRMSMSADRVRALSVAATTELAGVRVMGDGGHVMRLPREMSLTEAQAVADRLANDPSVLAAEPDRRRFALQAVTDGYFPLQWNLREPMGGINAEAAWSRGALGQNVVVAVLDTGIIQTNRDLTLPVSRLVAGYDFVGPDAPGVFATANDGDGRDPDPRDPGNWITAEEAGRYPFGNCATPSASDWHGTVMAGIIAANANNGSQSIVGVAYQAVVQPVRVLGKCGGYVSDIADGIRWAAGLSVSGVPANATPAKVINMSLGSMGPCSGTEQAAITAALGAGVKAIVTAAGNEAAGSVSSVAPANCTGVIAVGATDRSGSRTPYTNLGNGVRVSAPGGWYPSGCTAAECANGILSNFNAGTTIPSSLDAFAYVIGTSEAAAHVSGVIALMLSANPGLGSSQIPTFLAGSARPFPDCTCATSACGAGIVDADGAVRSALVGSAQPSSVPAASCPGRASIIGGVYIDGNGNRIRDPAEAGQAGVTIILSNSAGAELARTLTNESGNYVFMSLPAGTYRVSKIQPAGASGTAAVAGTAGGTAGVNATSGIVLAALTFGGGYDFPLTSVTSPSPIGGSGGGGGGGCAAGGSDRVDPLLAMLALAALLGIARRRRRQHVPASCSPSGSG